MMPGIRMLIGYLGLVLTYTITGFLRVQEVKPFILHKILMS